MVSGTFILNPCCEESWRLAPPKTLPDVLPAKPVEWWMEAYAAESQEGGTYARFTKTLDRWLSDVGAKGQGQAGVATFYKRPGEATIKYEGRFTNPSLWKRNVLKKVVLHLDELCVLKGDPSPSANKTRRLETLQRLLCRVPWSQVGMMTPEGFGDCRTLISLRSTAQDLKRACENAIHVRLITRWRERMQNSAEGDKKEMARWVREESSSLKGIMCGQSIITHPLRILDTLVSAWTPVYLSSQEVDPLEEREVGATAECPLEPVTAAALKTALHRRTGGAPALRMLKAMPDCMWERVAQTLREVERDALGANSSLGKARNPGSP